MRKRKAFIFTGLLITIAAIVLSFVIFRNNILFPCFIMVAGTIVIFFGSFETNYDVTAEKIVLIAILSAISSIGRILFSSIPSVQPSSFIIIITGAVFGEEMGFMVGSITALASNLILGQGPWTIWQMFSWGMMGLVSGLLSSAIKNHKVFSIIYGFVWGLVFGWIMNLWMLTTGSMSGINLAYVILIYIRSFPMDLAHGITNAVLLFLLSGRFIKILNRIAIKYGLTTAESI